MTFAIGGRARANALGGLEQFDRRGAAGDIGYCIAGATPYALEFNNDTDVICLLLGDISTETKFEDGPERPLVFMKQSSAFHPRGGNVRVRAGAVRNGFIAFSYARSFQEGFDDIDPEGVRAGGSRNNIKQERIRSAADYALGRLRSDEPLKPFEIQSLASLVYLETMRCLGTHRERRGQGLSDREFKAISEFIDAELNQEITCAEAGCRGERAVAGRLRRHAPPHGHVALSHGDAKARRAGLRAPDQFDDPDFGDRAPLRLLLAAAPDVDAVEPARRDARKDQAASLHRHDPVDRVRLGTAVDRFAGVVDIRIELLDAHLLEVLLVAMAEAGARFASASPATDLYEATVFPGRSTFKRPKR